MVKEHIQIFQERQNVLGDIKFQETLQEHIRFSRRKKYHKNRSNFLGELSRTNDANPENGEKSKQDYNISIKIDYSSSLL